jgi:hypothetical protein
MYNYNCPSFVITREVIVGSAAIKKIRVGTAPNRKTAQKWGKKWSAIYIIDIAAGGTSERWRRRYGWNLKERSVMARVPPPQKAQKASAPE